MRRALIVLTMVLVGCGSSGSDAALRTTGATTAEAKATTTAVTSPTPSTTIPPSTTTALTVPGDLNTPVGLCTFLSSAPRVADNVAPLWANIGQPPPAADRGPILNVGWAAGGFQTDAEMATGVHDQIAILLPYLHHALLANPSVAEVVIVMSGTNFDVSKKTIYQPATEVVRSLDPTDAAAADRLAGTAESAEWTGGRLPFTYVGPAPSQLDADGVFVGGPCP